MMQSIIAIAINLAIDQSHFLDFNAMQISRWTTTFFLKIFQLF